MKRLAVLAVVLVLGGCANLTKAYDVLTGTTISPTTVYVAANSFDTLEASATNYLRLPPCTATSGPVCRNQAIAVQIVSAVRKGRPIRNQLENLIFAGNGAQPVPASLYATIMASIGSIQALLAGTHQ